LINGDVAVESVESSSFRKSIRHGNFWKLAIFGENSPKKNFWRENSSRKEKLLTKNYLI